MNMLKRRHFHIGDIESCVLCTAQDKETIGHLIFNCPFSQTCWSKIGISYNSTISRIEATIRAKEIYSDRLFFEIFTITAWNIWKERNNFIFNQISPSHRAWLERTKVDLTWLTYRVSPDLSDYITSLVNSL
uniref:Reverse transcriptase zinc-binding domain-containing protein n=1 Tax=Hordeum vulgare subsp. vulgare TaxID=112509 RepID=A0A8I7B3T1_HORVV